VRFRNVAPLRNTVPFRYSSGFTVVELIASIVLVALISAGVSSSRWFGDDAYRVNTAATQLVSVARLAQKVSLSHGGVDIHLTIARLVDGWQYSVVEDDGGTLTTLHTFDVDGDDVTISITADIGPSLLSSGTNLDLEFDALGNITDVYVGAVQGSAANGIAILLSGSFDFPICISPLGFAHDGSCV